MHRRLLFLPLALFAAGCGDPQQQALTDVKGYIQKNLDQLYTSVSALQADAPAPDADGWNNTADKAAVDKLKADWRQARQAYEHVEGAIAVLFPEYDISTDERYDGFVATDADDDLFDDQGVTGIHAVERILWSDSIPGPVIEFEQGLPHYVAAAFPANETQAREFKEKLLVRLVSDVKAMKTQFAPLALDPAAAYRGVIGSMGEQLEKARKAATAREESRYAQYTLADMRANVQAGQDTYNFFRAALLAKKGGDALDKQINASFKRLLDQYATYSGDALPPVPQGFNLNNPSDADLATPFGQLYKVLTEEADETREGSLVHAMSESADLLGIERLP